MYDGSKKAFTVSLIRRAKFSVYFRAAKISEKNENE